MSNAKSQKATADNGGIQIESRDAVQTLNRPNLETETRKLDGFEIVTVVGVQKKVQWAN